MIYAPQFFGSYGAAEAGAGTGPSSGTDYTAYVPFLQEVLWGSDPREEAAVLEARIKNYRRLSRSSAGLIKLYYTNELGKMEARLAALKGIAAEAQTSVDTTQMTKVVLIGVGVATVLALGAFAFAQVSKAKYISDVTIERL